MATEFTMTRRKTLLGGATLESIDAPTPYVGIIARTQTNGVKDYEAVHKVQNGYKITLLPDWGSRCG